MLDKVNAWLNVSLWNNAKIYPFVRQYACVYDDQIPEMYAYELCEFIPI